MQSFLDSILNNPTVQKHMERLLKDSDNDGIPDSLEGHPQAEELMKLYNKKMPTSTNTFQQNRGARIEFSIPPREAMPPSQTDPLKESQAMDLVRGILFVGIIIFAIFQFI